MKARWFRGLAAVTLATIAACSAAPDATPGPGTATGGGTNTGGSANGTGTGGVSLGGSSGTSTGGAGNTDAGTTTTDKCDDGQDNDGNGLVDEGCVCSAGATQACWSGPAERRNVGQCKDGVQGCQNYGEFASWGQCVGEVLPSVEVPGNGIDEDCDGDDPGGPCVPTSTYESCSSGKDDDCNGLQDCQDPACASVCNCVQENCGDGQDNDCDNQVDCKDADCVQATGCIPVTGCTAQFPFFIELVCNDNADNDCDGKVDCDDPDCKRPGECGCTPEETSCTDAKDEDCDKGADCADLDCQKCTPGSMRWCDDPKYCHWGQQFCGPDGKFGVCNEVTTAPGNCTSVLYSKDCCVAAGACCQNYPTDQSSVGNCSNVTQCSN